MTIWRKIWFWFLLNTFVSWLALELTSIAFDYGYVAFTLSDTIRDWEVQYPWIKWAVGATFIGLWIHFFVQKNTEN